MSRRCQITGKRPERGFTYTLRGIAKKKKGIGLKVTGKTKRRFLPNIVTKNIWSTEENRFIKLKIAASALRLIDKVGLKKALSSSKSRNV